MGGGFVSQMGGLYFEVGGVPHWVGITFEGGFSKKIVGWGSAPHYGKPCEALAKWKEVKGKPDKINELILETKADLKEEPDNI